MTPNTYPKAKAYYTCGSCHVLAYYLVVEHFQDHLFGCLEDHAFVVTPCKQYSIDITGKRPIEDTLHQWQDHELYGEDPLITYHNNGYGRDAFLAHTSRYVARLNPYVRDNWATQWAGIIKKIVDMDIDLYVYMYELMERKITLKDVISAEKKLAKVSKEAKVLVTN